MGSTNSHFFYRSKLGPRPCIPDKFYIPHCVYHGKPCHRLWRFKLDIYGYCVQEPVSNLIHFRWFWTTFDKICENAQKYNPDNGEKANKKISVGRQTSLRRVSLRYPESMFGGSWIPDSEIKWNLFEVSWWDTIILIGHMAGCLLLTVSPSFTGGNIRLIYINYKIWIIWYDLYDMVHMIWTIWHI